MLAIVFALCSSLAWGTGDFLGGLASRRCAALAVLAWSQIVGLAMIAVIVVVSQDSAPGLGAAAIAAAAGLCSAFGLAALYRGMAVGAMGVVAPVAATSAAIPFAVGLARGEHPGALQIAGVAAALIGVAVISREGRGATGARPAAVGLGLLAAGGFGLYFVLIDRAAEHGAAWSVLVARSASSAGAIVVALAIGTTLALQRSLMPAVGLIGVFDVSANLLFALASTKGLLSVVSVLASLYPVVTVALARIVIDERLRPSQWAGAGLTLTGAALIAAG